MKTPSRLVRPLLAWFEAHARDLPWRRTRDPYAIWISEIMLQQTQVVTVQAYWERWLREWPDVAALAKATPARVHKLWEGLGYYARARNAHAAAKLIVEKQGGQFPKTFEEVLALPGIGRYTAGAICSIAYGMPTPILDGNVMRVLTRVYGVSGDPRTGEANEKLWELAAELVGVAEKQGKCGKLNESLMELGALVCLPVAPKCKECPVASLCYARREDAVARFPEIQRRAKIIQRRFAAFVVRQKGRYLVRQRPAGVVNAHLWEFPNHEVSAKEKNPARGIEHFTLTELTPGWRVRHSITTSRITLDGYRAELVGNVSVKNAPGEWKTMAQMDRLAFTAAHRKILEQIKLELRGPTA